MSLYFAKSLVATLPKGLPGLFNPWSDVCEFDTVENGVQAKIIRLAAHLDAKPDFILCGEAPGYQGCRHTGIAFTSEYLVLNGSIPRLPPESNRLTLKERPLKEPSATMVWDVLRAFNIAERTLLWNALMLHPHHPGQPRSNRSPTDQELDMGKASLALLKVRFPGAKIIAIGKKAEFILRSMGIPITGSVRHPANGGANQFRYGFASILANFKD